MPRASKDVNVNIRTKADTSGLDKTAKALGNVEKEAKQAETRTQRLAKKFDELGASIPGSGPISGFFRSLTSGAGKATLAIGATAAAIGVLFSLLKQGIGRVSITEDLEASFETLLGSAEAAKARIKEVTEFASETPLSIAGLATASRVLETLSNGALGAEESLRLVGDAAAVAQRPGESLDQTIQNVALHVGRLNSALTTGKGQIGESTLRLQELGLIGADTAYKLRELHQEGTKGTEAWALLEDSLKKFSGEMDRRSKTISGRVSTLKDAWNGFTAAVARPIAPAFKASVLALTGVLNGLSGAINGTLRFFGLIEKDSDSAAAGVEKSAEKIKAAVADLTAAIEKGSQQAGDGLMRLADNYDHLESKIGLSVKRAEELRKLQLDLEIQRIEADDSLTPLEKAQRKGAAREAAGIETSQAVIDAIQGQIERSQQERRDQQEGLVYQQEREDKIANQIAELKDALASRPGGARQANIDRLNAEIERLRKREAELGQTGNLGPSRLAIGVQRQRLQLEGQVLDLQRGQSLPVDDKTKARQQSQLAALQEELANTKEQIRVRSDELEATKRKHSQDIEALESALAFERQKANAQAQLERGNTRESVTRERKALEKADFTERARDAEPVSGALLNAGGAAAQASARAARGAQQLTEAAENIARVAQGNIQATNRLASLLGNLNGQVAAIQSEVKVLEAQIRNNRR